MNFDIRKHFTSDRTTGNIHVACPNCQSPNTSNPALSINLDSGAYHCFKCEGEKNGEIRSALGEARSIIPSTSKPPEEATVTPQEVRRNHQRLINESRLGKDWLLQRGFTEAAIAQFQLGIKRIKRLNQMWWCISVPIPASSDGTKYYQKLRIQPWMDESDRPQQLPKWDQKGIKAQTWFTWNPAGAKETYLCEGEWDAMLLGWMSWEAASKIAIATFTCGCDTVPAAAELEKLPGRVTIFYDCNDKPNQATGERPGEKGAEKVATALGKRGFVASIPQKEEHSQIQGWDVSDAINAGFTLADFAAAAAIATQPKPKPEANPLRERLVSTAELMARAPDHIDWLVPDLLPADEMFILAASARAGKSLLAMLLTKAVATGDKFLNRPCTQGSVLYVNLEDSEAKIKQRALAQGWGEDLPIYWLDRFKLWQLPDLRRLAQELDVRLIVFDTLSRIREDGIQESSAEISQLLEPLQQMANELSLAVLLVHHTTKVTIENANSTNVFDTIRGSSAIRAVCRGSWILAANERVYRLCVEHGFGDNQDLELRLDSESLQWKSVRPWIPKAPPQSQQILDYLSQVGKATISEIAKALNLNAECVKTALWRFQHDNQVWKTAGKKNHPTVYHYTQSISKINENGFGNIQEVVTELLPNHDSNRERDSSQSNSLGNKTDHPLNKSDQFLIDSENPLNNGNFRNNIDNEESTDQVKNESHNVDSESSYSILHETVPEQKKVISIDSSLYNCDPNYDPLAHIVTESEKTAETPSQHEEKFGNNSVTTDHLLPNKGSELPKSDQNQPRSDQTFIHNDEVICDQFLNKGDQNYPNSDHILLNGDEAQSHTTNQCTESDCYTPPTQKRRSSQLKVGDVCKWVGDPGAMAVVCRGKELRVLAVRRVSGVLEAQIKAEKWATDYWVKAADLKRL